MLTVSKGFLKLLAALVWFTGGIVLTIKGISLLIEAESMHPEQVSHWLAFVVAVIFGSIKARYFFSRVGKKNLTRIDTLSRPKFWQFFRMRFFVMLISMIILGVTLSQIAHGNHNLLIAVGVLDLSIAFALLGSSYIFWMRKVFLFPG